MNFAEAMNNETRRTQTTNGALAINSTGDALVDLFGSIGALRNASENRIETLFTEAYNENPLSAMKILFYARDIRGGLGERNTFRILIKYIANNYPEALVDNIYLIPIFGRYDDLYYLIDTKLEDNMWEYMKSQFEQDLTDMKDGLPVSLLAKWIKTPDASSPRTRNLGIKTALKMGYKVPFFKRRLKELRKYIDITEIHMCNNEWDKIDYSTVPSRAMYIYKDAFIKHDCARFEEFLNDTRTGVQKINASTLYPYDLVSKYITHIRSKDDTIEALWKSLPNYIDEPQNILVMCDTSGSMTFFNCRPLSSAIGLSIYFAERNTGVFHDMFMTFETEPHLIKIKGDTLYQKVHSVAEADWNGSTNLQKAFLKVLSIAKDNGIKPEDMPRAIIVISDMQIDEADGISWTFYNSMKYEFKASGYEIPDIIFWNVNSTSDVFHADYDREGVQLVSGHSVVAFKNVIKCLGYDPVKAMNEVINDDRYSAITIRE